MHALAAVGGFALIVLMLSEFFVAFLLPRRVKRDVRLARHFYTVAWRPWRALAARLPPTGRDTLLGVFGPFSLLATLTLWTSGLILGYALLHWANQTHVSSGRCLGFGDDLYLSAGTFFSASTGLDGTGTAAHLINVVEAASGFAVFFIAIGYLPALYQAFSRREVAVSRLDPRAGSPPTAGALLVRSGQRRGWSGLDDYLRDWEEWAAELMETHLSYPVLGLFRSQHVNQTWLGAMITVMDTCAFTIAFAPAGEAMGAQPTYAVGRHALADLAHAYRARPREPGAGRLDDDDLAALLRELRATGLEVEDSPERRQRLRILVEAYEPFAEGLSERLELPLPAWRPDEDAQPNWRAAAWSTGRGTLLP